MQDESQLNWDEITKDLPALTVFLTACTIAKLHLMDTQR